MTLTSFASTHDTVNLLRNACWVMGEAFWTISTTGNGSKTLKIEAPAISLAISSQLEVLVQQNFTLDPVLDRFFDFQSPLQRGRLSTLPHGYDTREKQTLPKSVPYSISLDLDVQIGDVEIKFEWDTGSGDWQLFRKGFSGRITLSAVPSFLVERAGVRLRSAASSPHAEAKLGRWMLSPGRFTELPYTGDPLDTLLPKNTVILWMGAACPAGFELLPEENAPKSSWLTTEPGALERLGNYPISATEILGEVTHAIENLRETYSVSPTVSYEGKKGNLYLKYTSSPENPASAAQTQLFIFTDFITNNKVDSNAGHTHSLSLEKLRPVSVGLKFCRRL